MSGVTKFLVVLAVAVVAGGTVYSLRPAAETGDLPSTTPTPQVESAVDNTVPFPAPVESPELITINPIKETMHIILKTTLGDIELELDGKAAPNTVGNFVKLAEEGFYKGTTFHRVIPGFMVQAGDPLSKDQEQRERHGTGGPGYAFADEINSNKIVRGSVAMANAGPNTNGSQFFIVTAEATPHLDGRHTNFGQVVAGMEIVDQISEVERDLRDNPLEPIVINEILVERKSEGSSPQDASAEDQTN